MSAVLLSSRPLRQPVLFEIPRHRGQRDCAQVRRKADATLAVAVALRALRDSCSVTPPLQPPLAPPNDAEQRLSVPAVSLRVFENRSLGALGESTAAGACSP